MNGNAQNDTLTQHNAALFADPSLVWTSTAWCIDGSTPKGYHVLVSRQKMEQAFGIEGLQRRDEGVRKIIDGLIQYTIDPSRLPIWARFWGEQPDKRGQSYLGAFVPIVVNDR